MGGVLFQTPTIDRFDIEAPITANFEGGQTAALELTVDRGRMNLQIVRELFDGQDMAGIVVYHLSQIPRSTQMPLIGT